MAYAQHSSRTVSASILLAATGIIPVLGAQAPSEAMATRRVVARVDGVIEQAFARRSGVAAACLVARGGKVLARRNYGSLGESRKPVTGRTLFDVGAVAKQFTAAAVLVLSMQERLGLDDSIGEHLPDVPERFHKITIRHLLTHTSGLPSEVDLVQTEVEERDLFLAAVFSEPKPGRSGVYFRYSDVGYGVAAAIVESIAGESFESFMNREVFRPAGMRATGFVGDEKLDRRRALPRVEPGEGLLGDAVRFAWGWGRRGSTGVVSSARDLHKWSEALRGDRVLDAKHRGEFFKPYTNDYALGWEVVVGPDDRALRVTHGGSAPGFHARVTRHVARETTVILLGNANADVDSLDVELTAILQGQELLFDVLSRHAGRYRYGTKNSFDVTLVGGQLQLRSVGQEASSRLYHGQPTMPEWPKFYAEVAERAPVLIRPLLENDLASFGRGFHDDAPRGAAEASIDMMSALVSEHGRVRGYRILGTRASGQMYTWFRVVVGEQPITLRAQWHGQELHQVVCDPTPFPFSVALVPSSEREFTATSLDGAAQILVRFEGGDRGVSKALRLFDHSKSGKRGLLCRRVK